VRILPEPSHDPVGPSYETFPGSRRWTALALLVMVTIATGLAAAVRLA